ncbi:hypothetical protein [Marinobacter zhejiangensis]|uniref:Uncharacterized protein n=1 Tax=Marinobacter zhejiangensis TaxID=488535 RepID=A0A1I4NDE1_9GAMM|nr:hypothetical protein [Marinobacter zhejiangensis]SFM13310.1 hypothetical protein SAMN04487963_1301 [Marinobacter zhejiangensis]
MRLNVDDEFEVVNPGHSDLDKIIGEMAEDEFIVLIREDEYYIQAYFDSDPEASVIEYREGQEGNHFSASAISKEKVLEAFSLYLDGNEGFKKIHQWEMLEIDEIEYLEEE